MSLDVSLTYPVPGTVQSDGKIFVRENGRRVELTRAEWDERYPGREPTVFRSDEALPYREVYSANITHNLAQMAKEAGLWEALWRPEENDYKVGGDLVGPLSEGLARLEADPDGFAKFNPENGWGHYEGLVEFTRNYMAACQVYFDAQVVAHR